MYTEFEIIESKDIREEILNNNNSLAIMENYKTINTVNKTEYASVKQVAEYFNVTLDCIQQLILRNKEELIENGLLILKGNETKNILGNDNLSLPKNIKGGFIIDNIQFNNRSNNLINKRCFLNIAMLLRDSEVAKDLRYLMLNVIENKLDNQVTNTVQIVDNTNTELMKGILNSNTMIANTLMQLTNVINDKNENKVLVATDEIELQILNLADEFMTIQDYCRFLNGKNILPKKIGIQVVNQLFRNNNIYKENNAPTKENLMKGYFEFTTKEDSTNLIVCLTKQGMIMLYRIAKEQFTEDFIVDRNYKTKN